MQTKKAFSFVEIIIVVSIITLLAVVGMSYQQAQNQKATNTRTIGDLGTLNNSLLSYLEDKKTLPLPKGNKNYYTKETDYSHDENGAFGVHGFVTSDLLPKKYLNYLPLDPRTNQYYAYGKTLDNKFYEIAGVIKENDKYKTKLQGNYPADNGPYSLIKEYNGANFVSNNSKISFPYNPEERILVGKINNFIGTVKIIGQNNRYIISDPNGILSHTLVEGDTIETGNNSQTTIFFSDGSQSVLEKNSKIVLKELKFKEKDNLLTRVNIFLDSGTLWTKVTQLNSKGSEFEVYTDDTTASVKGTIFGIKYDGTKTYVTVIKGIVEIKQKGGATVNKTGGQSYNSQLTQPDFKIIKQINNNTFSGANLQATDLISEYKTKNPKKEIHIKENPIIEENNEYELLATADYNTILEKENDLNTAFDLENISPTKCNDSMIEAYNFLFNKNYFIDKSDSKFKLCKNKIGGYLCTENYYDKLQDNWGKDFHYEYIIDNKCRDHNLRPWKKDEICKIDNNDDDTIGLFLDNDRNNHLKYNISSLKLGNNFKIEMRIKGLNRTEGNKVIDKGDVNKYTLFQIGDKKLFLDTTEGKIKFGTDDNYISLSNDNINSDFHKLEFIYNDGKIEIKIEDSNIDYTSTNNEIKISNKNTLYIGSNKIDNCDQGNRNDWHQWNSVIDYFKIYKKK